MRGEGQWDDDATRNAWRRQKVAAKVGPKGRLIALAGAILVTLFIVGFYYSRGEMDHAYIFGAIGGIVSLSIAFKLVVDLGLAWVVSGLSGRQRQLVGYAALFLVVLYVIWHRFF